MIPLHPLVALVPASRTMPAKPQAKVLGHRHQLTMSFAVALAYSTRQWTLVSWHKLLTTVRAKSVRTVYASLTRHRRRMIRNQRAS